MKLIIAGKDKSSDLGYQIADRAKKLEQNNFVNLLSPQHSALRLKKEVTSAEYLGQFIQLLRIRHGVNTAPFKVPARTGLSGRIMAMLRRFLWKLLRYQHDRITFQQNLINELLIDGIEMQQKMIQDKTEGLIKRMETLETEIRRLRGSS